MKPFCVLLGDGNPFVVDVDPKHDTVADLQKQLRAEKAHSIYCEAEQLGLFTTNHHGEWLDDEHPDIAELSHAEVSIAFFGKYLRNEHRMKPTRMLSEYCDAMTPQSRVIHVLVQLPQVVEAFTELDISTSQMLQEIYANLMQTQNHVKSVYQHQEMTRAQGVAMMHEFGMYLELFKVVEPEPKVEIQPYQWIAAMDAARMREAHKEYLLEHLKDALDARELGLVAADPMDDVLRVEVPEKHLEFRGGAELLVVDNSVVQYPESVGELPRLRMVIEVHRDAKFSKHRTYQAVSQLIATDLLVRRPTMCLMTNLTDYWRFFWLSTNRTVHSMVFRHAANAFELMRNVVLATPSVTDDQKYWRSWFFDMLTNKNEEQHERKASCVSTVSSSE